MAFDFPKFTKMLNQLFDQTAATLPSNWGYRLFIFDRSLSDEEVELNIATTLRAVELVPRSGQFRVMEPMTREEGDSIPLASVEPIFWVAAGEGKGPPT